MAENYKDLGWDLLREKCRSRQIFPLPSKKDSLIAALEKWDQNNENNENINNESGGGKGSFKEPKPKSTGVKRKELENDKNDNENENDSDFCEPDAKRRKVSKSNKSKNKSKSKSKSKNKNKTNNNSSSTSSSSSSSNEKEANEEKEGMELLQDKDEEAEEEEDDDVKGLSKSKSKSCNSADTIKILCFNINGVRAAAKHGLANYLETENADIVCFSEMKADLNQNPIEFDSNYQVIWNECTEKKGYAGTCILTKMKPISISKGIGCEDAQGRAIIVEFEKFYLVNTYVPNSGQKLKFEERRKEWDKKMKTFLKTLQSKKSVIWTGDLNVAVEDFDVYDGTTNKSRCKTAGFTPYERENFRNLLNDLDMVDSWRQMYPEKKTEGYTFFTARSRGTNMKEKNMGWRLDYFVVSKNIMPLIQDIKIEREIGCSDHVPLVLTLSNPNDNL